MLRYVHKLLVLTALLLLGTTVTLGQGASLPEAHADRPNVIFILADDLGWSDTTLYGTTDFYRTPNIQRLARRGMTFTRAYSASPLCSPTRASILTGLAPARHGITAPRCHVPAVVLTPRLKSSAAPTQKSIQPDSVSRLAPSYTTLAETLKQAGYATGHFGKWHLGAEPYSPLQHGFDVDVPHWPGPGPAGSYVAPWKFKDFDHDPDIPDEHIEDRMAKEAVAFMQDHHQEPFFLNYWMFSVHAPFDAKKALVRKYRGTVNSQDAQRCPTYAAMIESMDDAIGTLLDAIDRLGIARNTIIIFASDNGGNMYNLVEGQRPTSNRPLRGGKATMYEGGVRTPAIVVRPGHVKPNTQSDAIIQSMDYYPTLLDMLDIEPAAGQAFDGISLMPALRGESLRRDGIFTYFPHSPPVPEWIPPSVSIHTGKWKLIRIFHGGHNGAHRYKLFDLSSDIGERTDLSVKEPDRVRALDALIEAHLQSTKAIVPARNPNFDPAKYDPTTEGIPAERHATGARGPRSQPRAKPVAGWQPGGTCRLSRIAAGLRVQSTGKDPYLSYSLPTPAEAGKYRIDVRMKSNSAGSGQFYWRSAKQRFARERSRIFDVRHDGNECDYSIEFSASTTLSAVRLDPARAKGQIDILHMQLIDENGKIVHTWAF